VIEPTPEVREKVNQPRPLGNDMSSLRPNTDLYDRFSNEAIREQTPTERDDADREYMRAEVRSKPSLPSKGKITMNGKPVELDENGEFRSEDGSVSITNNDSVISDDKKADAQSMYRTVQNAKAAREGRDPPFPDHEATTEAEEEFSDKQAAKRARMAPKGKGGQKIDKPASQTMTMKDLVKPKQAESEVPRLGSRPKDEDVMKVIEMVQNGNAKAKTALYAAMGDLEDMGSPHFDDAQEALDEYKATEKQRRAERRKNESSKRKNDQEKNLSTPLTDAKNNRKMTNEDVARRLLGKRD
jgi:hypothetical protein